MNLYLDKEIEECLIANKFISSKNNYIVEKLSGGVSSDIWKITNENCIYCLKKAKNKLDVKEDWYVPIERNIYEYEWYNEVNKLNSNIAPKVIYSDSKNFFFIMEYFDEKKFPLWKKELFKSNIDISFSQSVAQNLSFIHLNSFNNNELKNKFDTIKLFEDLRIDPYIRFTATIHDDIKNKLLDIANDLHNKKITLVHGDISPKNILINNKKPIFLDAECAWYGDPAFDLAFCINHLLLKSIKLPKVKKLLYKSFITLSDTYLMKVKWEDPKLFEKRTILILSALMLGRIDGKSPVEYITSNYDKQLVRSFSKSIIQNPTNSLLEFSNKWFQD